MRRSSVSLTVALLCAAARAFAAPAAPTNLSLTPDGDGAILRWRDNSTDETQFLIGFRDNSAGNFTLLATLAANVEEARLNNVPEGSTREFVVVAANDTGQSPLSNIVSRVFRVTSFSAISAEVNKPFTFTVSAVGPTAVTSLTAAPLPAGLTFNAATGVISGTPPQTGTTPVTITATREGGETVTGSLALRVYEWQEPPALAAPVLVKAPEIPALRPADGPKTIALNEVFTDPDTPSAARVTTDAGVMDFIFYPDAAPRTVENFLGYAHRGDFTNSFFHRSVRNFVIQGGGFKADASASAVPTVVSPPNEPKIRNRRGTVAMAKLGTDPNSATCQFFINLADNAANLDNQNNGFTVFARVAGNGMAVADAIAALPTKSFVTVNGALGETPVKDGSATAYNPENLVRFQSIAPVPPLAFTAVSSAPGTVTAEITAEGLRLTPVAEGSADVTVTATDLDGLTVSHTFRVSVSNGLTYAQWAAANGFASPEDAEASADPDRDGLVNLLEYALAAPPLASSPAATEALTVTRENARHAAIRFTLGDYLSGVTAAVEAATDLAGPWQTVWEHGQGTEHPLVVESVKSDGKITLTVRAAEPLSAEAPRRFLRLKVAAGQ